MNDWTSQDNSPYRLSKVADDLNLQLFRKWQERKAFESVDNDSPLIVLKEVAEISRVLQHCSEKMIKLEDFYGGTDPDPPRDNWVMRDAATIKLQYNYSTQCPASNEDFEEHGFQVSMF